MKVLLIEDNPTMQASLQRTLERKGMAVQVCDDGLQALDAWAPAAPDVVVLDLTLPGLDGLQVLERARSRGYTTPVLILTARGTIGDKILGLNTGADDYLAKPFDLDELEARLHALGRRSPQRPSNGPATVEQHFGGLWTDGYSGAVHGPDGPLDLPPRELALLRALLARPGQAVTKERLFEQVFPDAQEVQYEAIEVVVYRLRKKLAATRVQVVTLRGLGYLLKAQP